VSQFEFFLNPQSAGVLSFRAKINDSLNLMTISEESHTAMTV